jgi:hypothetical protein
MNVELIGVQAAQVLAVVTGAVALLYHGWLTARRRAQHPAEARVQLQPLEIASVEPVERVRRVMAGLREDVPQRAPPTVPLSRIPRLTCCRVIARE